MNERTNERKKERKKEEKSPKAEETTQGATKGATKGATMEQLTLDLITWVAATSAKSESPSSSNNDKFHQQLLTRSLSPTKGDGVYQLYDKLINIKAPRLLLDTAEHWAWRAFFVIQEVFIVITGRLL